MNYLPTVDYRSLHSIGAKGVSLVAGENVENTSGRLAADTRTHKSLSHRARFALNDTPLASLHSSCSLVS